MLSAEDDNGAAYFLDSSHNSNLPGTPRTGNDIVQRGQAAAKHELGLSANREGRVREAAQLFADAGALHANANSFISAGNMHLKLGARSTSMAFYQRAMSLADLTEQQRAYCQRRILLVKPLGVPTNASFLDAARSRTADAGLASADTLLVRVTLHVHESGVVAECAALSAAARRDEPSR